MMWRRFYFLNLCIFLCGFLCSLLLAPLAGMAENDKPVQSDLTALMRSPQSMKFAVAIDGVRLMGADQKIYRLPNLMIPENFPYIAEKAQKRLRELALEQKCTLYLTRKSDRGRMNYLGELVAEPVCGAQNIWLSGQLVSEGLALVAPNISNPETVAELLTLETAARAAKIGIWGGEKPWEILTPMAVGSHLNSWQIVAGQIENVGMTKDTIFLNFGKNWKDDFTVGIPLNSPLNGSPNDLRREMMKNRINPQSLRGQTVRVRGWVREYNGAMIELETLGQLEILPPTLSNNTQTESHAAQDTAQGPAQDNSMHTIKNSLQQPTPPNAPESPEIPRLTQSPKSHSS